MCVLQFIYQSPSTQLFIMFNQLSYTVTCFDHKVVIFQPLAIAVFTFDIPTCWSKHVALYLV